MSQAVLKAFPFLWGGYIVSLTCSMSGMELFSSLLAVALFLLWIGQSFKPEFSTLPKFMIGFAAFMPVAWISLLFGEIGGELAWYSASKVRFFFLLFVVYFSFRVIPNKTSWIRILFFSSLVISAYGFFQHFIPMDLIRSEGNKAILYAISKEKIGPLVLGAFNHHLTFSNIFLTFACIFTALGLSNVKHHRAYLALGLLQFLDVIWTQSRVSWVAVPVCLVSLTYFKSKKLALGCCAILAALFLSLYAFDSGFRERLDRTLAPKDQTYNLSARKRLWAFNWELFKERPLIGVGYNTAEYLSHERLDDMYPNVEEQFYGHAHSMFLQVLATTGVLGFLVFFGSYFLMIWRVLMVQRNSIKGSLESVLSVGAFTALIGFLVQGLTQWNFGDAEVAHSAIFLWSLAAMLDGGFFKDFNVSKAEASSA